MSDFINYTSNIEYIKALTEINDKIMEDDDLDPRRTDVDLYRSIKKTLPTNLSRIWEH